MRRIGHTLLALILATSVTMNAKAQNDIVDTAIAAGNFNTLVQAVQAAGLVDALRGDGPFTVFAPTDDAFAQLPAETLNALLNDPDALSDILLYHVVSGAVLAADVVNLTSATTLQGEDVQISVTDGMVSVNDAKVIATDIQATNGVIHVIDSVLLPPEPQPDIVDTAVGAGRFNTLVAAVQAAGLEDALRGAGPFTVFAPNDDAFAKLPTETLDALLNDPQALADILLFHVVADSLDSTAVLASNSVPTLQGSPASISTNSDGAFIENAKILNVDIQTSNGIIHEIDTVIIPPEAPMISGTRYEVSVTNLTKGQIFSPPMVVSHRESISLFTLGKPASGPLATLAEDGNNQPFIDAIKPLDETLDVRSFDGVIMPGETKTMEIVGTGGFRVLSVVGMMVTTNDAFFSGSLILPRGRAFIKTDTGNYFYASTHAEAYDAGSEFNSEDCADIPGPPCGNPGVSPSEPGEGYVYISNGIHGIGDITSADYDWRGAVAIIEVKVK